MTAADKPEPASTPEDIELLLPWHANGTLSATEARRVEDALARDPALARQYAAVREEYAETILLNESLGAPSSRAMQTLFAAIDAEPARTPPAPSLSARLARLVAALSPRTLAYGAAGLAAVVVLQAGVIGAVVMKDLTAPRETFRTAAAPVALPAPPAPGAAMRSAAPAAKLPVALVRFAPEARLSELTTLLGSYGAVIVDGPRAGLFRIQFGDHPLPPQEFSQLLARLQAERLIGFAAAAE
jgi:anti-sigma factor RsiW